MQMLGGMLFLMLYAIGAHAGWRAAVGVLLALFVVEFLIQVIFRVIVSILKSVIGSNYQPKSEYDQLLRFASRGAALVILIPLIADWYSGGIWHAMFCASMPVAVAYTLLLAYAVITMCAGIARTWFSTFDSLIFFPAVLRVSVAIWMAFNMQSFAAFAVAKQHFEISAHFRIAVLIWLGVVGIVRALITSGLLGFFYDLTNARVRKMSERLGKENVYGKPTISRD